jgi:hypothetical protein
VNVVTRSGTNDFHGGAFEFVRNRVFNARNFFSPTQDFLKRNQFGAYAGGPVRLPWYDGRNRTFFFAGWQGTRIRNVANSFTAFAPTRPTGRQFHHLRHAVQSRAARSLRRRLSE